MQTMSRVACAGLVFVVLACGPTQGGAPAAGPDGARGGVVDAMGADGRGAGADARRVDASRWDAKGADARHVEGGALDGPRSPDGPRRGDGPAPPDGPAAPDGATTPIVIYAHSPGELYVIDRTTFDLMVVGSFGVPDRMTDLAVTPDGRVYTISATSAGAKVWRVDPRTAAATLVTTVPGTVSLVGLTFLLDDSLLGADGAGQVFRIDVATGQSALLGSYGMSLDTAGDLVVVSDGSASGVMFGISSKLPGGASAGTSNLLITVNPSTAAATPVGTGIGFGQVYGMAYVDGRVLAFTAAGQLIEIDRLTGGGRLLRTYAGKQFWGAGVTPRVRLQ